MAVPETKGTLPGTPPWEPRGVCESKEMGNTFRVHQRGRKEAGQHHGLASVAPSQFSLSDVEAGPLLLLPQSLGLLDNSRGKRSPKRDCTFF